MVKVLSGSYVPTHGFISFVSPSGSTLIAIPYLLDGLMLAAVYHLSKKNIYASIAAHMLNNLIAVILVFV